MTFMNTVDQHKVIAKFILQFLPTIAANIQIAALGRAVAGKSCDDHMAVGFDRGTHGREIGSTVAGSG